jgi:ribose transport system substrate-binding protein
MGIAVMEGMEIPELTKSPQVILTKDTVDKYYDANGKVTMLPPLVSENQYLAETGVLQKFNNIEGL